MLESWRWGLFHSRDAEKMARHIQETLDSSVELHGLRRKVARLSSPISLSLSLSFLPLESFVAFW